MPSLSEADLTHVLERSGDAWRELKGADVFITGATGFIGGWILETLLAAGERLGANVKATVLVRDADAFRARLPHLAGHKRIELHVGDVRTIDPPRGAFTHVVHCASAAPPKVNDERPDEVVDLIVRGTERVLDAAVRARATRFLMVGSGSVYGPQPPDLLRIDESYTGTADASRPAERFGAAKRKAEELGEARARDVGFVSARVFALVGPRLPLNGQFAMGQFLGDALAGRTIAIKGDGSPVRSYMYAADLAAWCWILLANGRPGRAYNVGSEDSCSLWRAAHDIAELVEPPLEVTRAATPSIDVPPARYVPSIARAREELGLDVWISREDALRRTFDWCRSAA